MNKKIGHKGFASLLFFLSQEIFLGVGLTRILSISEQNSWISILIAFVIGFIFLNIIIPTFFIHFLLLILFCLFWF